MLTLLLAVALAVAQDPTRVGTTVGVDHADVGGEQLFRIGLVSATIGMPLDGIGRAAQSSGLWGLGLGGEFAGVPLMTYGSLRSRAAIVAEGGHVKASGGIVAASLYGVSLAFDLAGRMTYSVPYRRKALDTVGAGAMIGAYLAALHQDAANERARVTILHAEAPHRRPTFALGVSALPGSRFAPSAGDGEGRPASPSAALVVTGAF